MCSRLIVLLLKLRGEWKELGVSWFEVRDYFSSMMISCGVLTLFVGFSSWFMKEIFLNPLTERGTMKFFLGSVSSNFSIPFSSSNKISSYADDHFIAEMQIEAISSNSFKNKSSRVSISSLMTYSSPFSPTLNISLIASVFISKEKAGFDLFGAAVSTTFYSSISYKGLKKSNHHGPDFELGYHGCSLLSSPNPKLKFLFFDLQRFELLITFSFARVFNKSRSS